jgi:hypothetical protein
VEFAKKTELEESGAPNPDQLFDSQNACVEPREGVISVPLNVQPFQSASA